MAQLTDAQVAQLALDVGWRADDAVLAVALALAFSGGDTTAGYGQGWPGLRGPVGLWGLNAERFPGLTRFDLFDPAVNARAANALYRAHSDTWSWSPVWAGGTWQDWLTRAAQAVTAPSRTAELENLALDTGSIRAAAAAVQAAGAAIRRAGAIGRLADIRLPGR